jgi:MoxR-like ATPase
VIVGGAQDDRAVRDLGVLRSSELYAQVASLLPREEYEAIVQGLVASGHVLVEGGWLVCAKEAA